MSRKCAATSAGGVSGSSMARTFEAASSSARSAIVRLARDRSRWTPSWRCLVLVLCYLRLFVVMDERAPIRGRFDLGSPAPPVGGASHGTELRGHPERRPDPCRCLGNGRSHPPPARLACVKRRRTMAVDERASHELFLRVEGELGPQAAETLMQLLPPVGWADVATKHDLNLRFEAFEHRLLGEIRGDINQLRAEVDGDFHQLRGEIHELRTEMHSMRGDLFQAMFEQTHTLFRNLVMLCASLVFTVAGLAFAAARLS